MMCLLPIGFDAIRQFRGVLYRGPERRRVRWPSRGARTAAKPHDHPGQSCSRLGDRCAILLFILAIPWLCLG